MNRMTRTIIVLALLCIAGTTRAQVLIVLEGAQKCAAVTPSQSNFFEWRDNALFNRDPNRALFAVCGYINNFDDLEFNGGARFVNTALTTETVECTWREIDLAGNKVQRVTDTITMVPSFSLGGGTDRRFNRSVPQGSYWSMTCLLPPDTGIISLAYLIGLTKDADPDKSAAAAIQMKNIISTIAPFEER